MKNRLALLICLAFLVVSIPAFGLEVYKYKNASGVTSYSDTPIANTIAEPEVVKMPDTPLRSPNIMRDESSDKPAESSPRSSAKVADAPGSAEFMPHKRSKKTAETGEVGFCPVSTGFNRYYSGCGKTGVDSSQDKLGYPFKEKTFQTNVLPVKTFGPAPIGSVGRK
ncbi:MAG: DUF4124 domain-containing protein [Deltaproteobacteria bacterium]|nr:DUF4124 domain-containing protein [Deltaproteobacteria bacterium]